MVLITGLTVLVLAFGLHWIGSRILLDGFARVEQMQVHEHLTRAENALNAMQGELSAQAHDWGARNEPYEFVEDPNPRFISSNITFTSLSALRLDVIAFVHRTGRIVLARGVDYEAGQVRDAPAGLLHRLTMDGRLTDLPQPDSHVEGILPLPEGLLVFACRPILTNEYKGPVRGTILFGRFLDRRRMTDLARQLSVNLAVHALGEPPPSEDCAAAVRELSSPAGAPELVRGMGDNALAGYRLIQDIDGRPSVLLKIQTPRRVLQQARRSLQYLKLAIVLTGLVCGALTLWLLRKLVLARVSALSRQVSEIAASGDPSLRVTAEGGDELAALAGNVNAMLEATSRAESVLRITQFSVDNATDPIFWISPEADVIYANDAACASLGYSREELLRLKVFNFDPDIQPENWAAHWEEVLRLRHFSFESRHRTKDGRIFPVEITTSLLEHNGTRCTCAFVRDITKRKTADESLRHAALHDQLTGLPNRVLLTEYLGAAIERSRQCPDYRFALMFLDFDRFKIINDSLGHQAGDRLLMAISNRLQACLRDSDAAFPGRRSRVARLGGDEFVILLDGIGSLEDATNAAERIQRELSAPFNLGGHQAHVTASIGIVTSETDYHSPADIIRDADTAMYQAKLNGKARFVVFDRQMHDQVMLRLQLESDLRHAIEQQQIEVAYQPIVSLETGELEGFEALARWTHPTRGEIPPDIFIPIAEETGLILPLGHMMLVEACRQWRRFREQVPDCLPLVMSVNVSKRQLMESDLPQEIERILMESGTPPEALKLEVTESVIMQDAETITPMLIELRRRGLKLAMDDFGQGHSSLGCLHKFPIDCLKIDRVFVSNMGVSESGLNIEYTAIVQAIVTLAHNLGMQVVAEGVEGPGQLVQLQSLGCDFGQGFHFARPVTSEQAIELILRRSWISGPARERQLQAV